MGDSFGVATKSLNRKHLHSIHFPRTQQFPNPSKVPLMIGRNESFLFERAKEGRSSMLMMMVAVVVVVVVAVAIEVEVGIAGGDDGGNNNTHTTTSS